MFPLFITVTLGSGEFSFFILGAAMIEIVNGVEAVISNILAFPEAGACGGSIISFLFRHRDPL